MKKLIHDNLTLVVALLFSVILILSLVFFFVFEFNEVKRVFFFPNDVTGDLNGEVRKLHRSKEDEENITLFVKEIILGPGRFENKPIIPRNTTLNTVILRDNKLYLDFRENIFFPQGRSHEEIEKIEKVLRESIKFNFPFIDTITITINGQIPRHGGTNDI